MTIRRIFFILLIHFLVMVSYPDYPQGGFSYGIMSAVLWSGVAILLGIIVTIFALENWKRLNMLFTLILVLACAWFVLQKFPQEDKVSPLKKISYAQLPSGKDMQKGLKAFGINFDDAKDFVEGAVDNAKEVRDHEKRFKKALGEE